jgi:hypothetical protein
MNQPLCLVPYYSLNVSHQYSNFCCKLTKPSPEVTVESWHSASAEALREKLVGGSELDPVCSACAVPQGYESRRVNRHRVFKILGIDSADRPVLKDLSISIDNVCASSCIACNSILSTAIARLEQNLTADQIQHHQLRQQPNSSSTVYQGLDLDRFVGHVGSVEILQIYGGEPLFSPQWPKIIDMINQHMPNLKVLYFNTGLNSVKTRWIDLLNTVDPRVKIRAFVSIDAPLDYNQWIRNTDPGDVMQGLAALKNLDRDITVCYQPVLANYNVWVLPELVGLLRELDQKDPEITFSTVFDPEVLKPCNLPPEIKAATEKKLTAAQAQETNPTIAASVYANALGHLKKTQTQPWDRSRERIELYPGLRGSNLTLDHWLDRYLPK